MIKMCFLLSSKQTVKNTIDYYKHLTLIYLIRIFHNVQPHGMRQL